MGSGLMLVVIRFQICIFDILNTASDAIQTAQALL